VDNHKPETNLFPESASIQIRPMQIDDLPLCRHLVTQAGWNQLDADWLRAIKLEPLGCFVAETNGIAVATTTTSVFENIGWIAMVLVDERVRKYGIGRMLLLHAIDYLEQKFVTTIRLDATALGQKLYSKLGFLEAYHVVRFAGRAPLGDFEPNHPKRLDPSDPDMSDLANLDQKVTATDRLSFLKTLITDDAPAYKQIASDGSLAGYACCRDGKNAVQIGPVISLTAEAGETLLDAVTSHFPHRQIFIDIPVQNIAATEWAKKNGLAEQRRFVRMYRGEKIDDQPQFIWASGGPEKG